MKLYWAPGTCALAPHIVLEELGLPFELDKVDTHAKKTQEGGDYLAVNPKGYVPSLRLDDGSILTEGVATLIHLGWQKPDLGLVPPPGTMERLRVLEWLVFIATELHKGFSPFFMQKLGDDAKALFRERLVTRYGWLTTQLAGKPYVYGSGFTIADAYLFTILRWGSPRNQMEVAKWPAIAEYFAGIRARPAVDRAMRAQGLVKA